MRKDVTFSLPAEALHDANEIVVLGSFNNWKPAKEYQLKKQKDGSASVTVSLEAGKTYEYRFLINGERWQNDYQAQKYEAVPGYSIDNCIITVSAEEETNVAGKSTEKAVKSKKAQTAKKDVTGAAASEQKSTKKTSRSSKASSTESSAKPVDVAEPAKTVSAKPAKGKKVAGEKGEKAAAEEVKSATKKTTKTSKKADAEATTKANVKADAPAKAGTKAVKTEPKARKSSGKK